MYRDRKKQETEQESLLIQGLHVNSESTKAAGASPATLNVSIPLQQTMTLEPTTVITVPEDLKEIEPWPYQIWNFDKIGFYPNGSWIKVVCTYKFFTRYRIWRIQTGDRRPFWCTDIIFARADVQCFMSPMIVHQAAN